VNARDDATDRVRRFYERAARDYDHWTDLFDRLLLDDRRVVLCSQARGRTLEVGVGTGRNLALYGPDIEVTGIDVSAAMLEIARRRIEARGKDLRVGDAHSLQFPNATFDTVVFTLTLCTIPNERQALAEARRVLRPGGRLLTLEHVRSPNAPVRWVQRALDPLFSLTGDHLLRDPLDHVEQLGFEVEFSKRRKGGLIEEVIARAIDRGYASPSDRSAQIPGDTGLLFRH
jgi:ubiquinone/menaquinone biosynthesis C-methylase UbiE